jgi:hypothetical protein
MRNLTIYNGRPIMFHLRMPVTFSLFCGGMFLIIAGVFTISDYNIASFPKLRQTVKRGTNNYRPWQTLACRLEFVIDWNFCILRFQIYAAEFLMWPYVKNILRIHHPKNSVAPPSHCTMHILGGQGVFYKVFLGFWN